MQTTTMEGASCPVSLETADHNVARVTGFLTISVLGAYLAVGLWWILAVLAVDYTIRSFTPWKSPMQWIATGIARVIGLERLLQDKAPKQFAARIGWLFVAASTALFWVNPVASSIVAAALLGFNALDSVANFCVGCWTYTSIVIPLRRRMSA